MHLANGGIKNLMVVIYSIVNIRLKNFYAVGFYFLAIGSHVPCYRVSGRLGKAKTAIQEWSYVIPAMGNAQNFDDIHLGQ